MTAQSQTFPMRGGLDQETPALAIKPGSVIDVLNFESGPTGYGRTEGYERYDGRSSPSAEIEHVVTFTLGVGGFTAGLTYVGDTSGATFVAVHKALPASGTVYVTDVVGTFIAAENISRSGVVKGKFATIAAIDPKTEAGLALLASVATAQRALITAVPGSGPVRGLLWYNNTLNAWRDNVGATAGIAHGADASVGWLAHSPSKTVNFTSGGTYEIVEFDTVTGATSGATGYVTRVYTAPSAAVDPWAAGTAEGTLVLNVTFGTFVAENLNVGANLNVATIAGAPTNSVFPPGGRYDFEVHNFRGAVGTEMAYGANGVGPAFEWFGVGSFISIPSGMPDDRPFLVEAHKNHLFLAFPGGSLQHSALGEPVSFDAQLGAAELGLGHEITNLIPNANATMFITTDSSVSVLTGNDSSDWVLEGIGDNDVGAKPYTAQRIGQIIYMDNRGVRSASSTDTYGNFRLGTFTSLINKTLNAKRKAGVLPVASIVVKGKDQYLLFFDDGTGFSLYFGTKKPEAMLFDYPFVVSCIHSAEVDGEERIWVGATDGFVYELNKGRSFDGAAIFAYIGLPYGHQGGPRVVKRYHKLALEVQANVATVIGVVAQFNYANGWQPNAESLLETVLRAETGGNPIVSPHWPGFTWYGPENGQVEAWVKGAGLNMGAILVTNSALIESPIIEGATVLFSPRGVKR